MSKYLIVSQLLDRKCVNNITVDTRQGLIRGLTKTTFHNFPYRVITLNDVKYFNDIDRRNLTRHRHRLDFYYSAIDSDGNVCVIVDSRGNNLFLLVEGEYANKLLDFYASMSLTVGEIKRRRVECYSLNIRTFANLLEIAVTYRNIGLRQRYSDTLLVNTRVKDIYLKDIRCDRPIGLHRYFDEEFRIPHGLRRVIVLYNGRTYIGHRDTIRDPFQFTDLDRVAIKHSPYSTVEEFTSTHK